jgi:hypothetical protein
MPHEIAGITECLICGRKFAGPQAIVIGQPRAVALLEKLAQHLETAHSDQNQAIALLSLQYVGLLRMMNFKTTDEMLKVEVDKLRWAINQQTIAARISDETIESKTNGLAGEIVDGFFGGASGPESPTAEVIARSELKQAIARRVKEVIKGMRDVMQEPNKYAVNLVGSPKRDSLKPDSALHRA